MTAFRFFTAGESHGRGLTAIVEVVPGALPLTEDQIARDLVRRQGGYGRGRRQEIEQDRARITSGVRHGKTIGSPIALWIVNRDWENANWQVRMAVEPVDEEVERVTLLRPGHADLVGTQKYGLDDVRPILERSSARETASRVAVGAVARAVSDDDHLVVICAGQADRFSRDDALCAGHLIQRIVSENEGEPDFNDAARAARALASARKPTRRFLSLSAGALAVTEIGLGDDLDICADVDRHDLVGVMSDQAITRSSD